jgi:hypothetical protein
MSQIMNSSLILVSSSLFLKTAYKILSSDRSRKCSPNEVLLLLVGNVQSQCIPQRSFIYLTHSTWCNLFVLKASGRPLFYLRGARKYGGDKIFGFWLFGKSEP